MKVNGQRDECVCDSNSRVVRMDDAGGSNCSHLFITLQFQAGKKVLEYPFSSSSIGGPHCFLFQVYMWASIVKILQIDFS